MKIGPNGDNENQAVSKADSKSNDDKDKDTNKDPNKNNEQKSDSNSKNNEQDSKSDKTNNDPNKDSDNKNDSDKQKEKPKDKADLKKQLKNSLKKALTNKKQKQKNPLKEKADKLGKKAAKKAARVAAPKMAAAYAVGKAYDKLHKGLAIALTALQQSLYNAFVNSPFAGFINFMHGLWQGAVNAVHAVGAFVGHAAGAVGSFLGGIGSAVGGAFGSIGSAFSLSATQLSTVIAVGALLFGGGIAGVSFVPNQGMRDGQKLASCLANVENAKAGGTAMTNVKQKELENAKKVYEAGRAFGLSKNQALALCGNFHVEGAFIDPTAVESIFDEPYTIGPRKKAALSDLGAYTSQVSQGRSGYTQGGACPGLGIGQWTGGNGLKLLAAAKKMNADWYSLDFQLAYVFGTPSPTGRTNFWDEFKKQSGSIEDCTAYFEQNWEGIMDKSIGERQSFAKSLENQADSWSGDSSFAKSVIAMAKKMGTVATDKAVSEAAADCADANDKANNSDAVKAALSYAWDSNELAKGNNGTPLYQKVCDGVLGDHLYQSCDRNVAAAMRWSGTDIDYPAGNTSVQLHYLEGSPKWKHIGNTKSVSYDQLQPGDVMCDDGTHTYLYVGNKAVKDSIASGQHKKSDTPANGDEVDASYGQRSAGIGVNAAFSVKQHGDGPYEIYRCVKPDKSDKYKNVASDVK